MLSTLYAIVRQSVTQMDQSKKRWSWDYEIFTIL